MGPAGSPVLFGRAFVFAATVVAGGLAVAGVPEVPAVAGAPRWCWWRIAGRCRGVKAVGGLSGITSISHMSEQFGGEWWTADGKGSST